METGSRTAVADDLIRERMFYCVTNAPKDSRNEGKKKEARLNRSNISTLQLMATF